MSFSEYYQKFEKIRRPLVFCNCSSITTIESFFGFWQWKKYLFFKVSNTTLVCQTHFCSLKFELKPANINNYAQEIRFLCEPRKSLPQFWGVIYHFGWLYLSNYIYFRRKKIMDKRYYELHDRFTGKWGKTFTMLILLTIQFCQNSLINIHLLSVPLVYNRSPEEIIVMQITWS